jgi:hypothetical protein
VVRVVVPFAETVDAGILTRSARDFSGTVALESLTRDAWRQARSNGMDALSQSIRAKFDPDAILNPGILGSARP